MANKHQDFHDLPYPVVMMESEWPSGSITGWHSHPRGQLLYGTEGVMVVHSDAGTWVVPPTRALWLVANVRHNVQMSGDVRMRSAYIDADRIPALPAQTSVIHVSPLLRELLIEGVRIAPEHPAGGREDRILDLIIDEIRVSPSLALHLPAPADRRLRSICDALIERPADGSSAAEWAASIHLAERSLHRLFARETGMSFSQWREQARLLHALRKIAEGGKVLDVAFECGYSSQSAFTAMFRRHFGVTPARFYR